MANLQQIFSVATFNTSSVEMVFHVTASQLQCIYTVSVTCIQQRKITCLLSIRKSLACARASKLATNTGMLGWNVFLHDIIQYVYEMYSVAWLKHNGYIS